MLLQAFDIHCLRIIGVKRYKLHQSSPPLLHVVTFLFEVHRRLSTIVSCSTKIMAKRTKADLIVRPLITPISLFLLNSEMSSDYNAS